MAKGGFGTWSFMELLGFEEESRTSCEFFASRIDEYHFSEPFQHGLRPL